MDTLTDPLPSRVARAASGVARAASGAQAAPSPSRVAAMLVVVGASAVACAPSSRPEPAPPADAPHENNAAAAIHEPAPAPDASGADERPLDASADVATTAPASAAAPPDAGRAATVDGAAAAGADANVKIVTIGMHVAGGPYDEPTKVPFKKAVEPRFPEIAQCWAQHVSKPPKQADFGVDLLIEAAGGKPKVSNPRSSLDKSETEGFTACVVGIFESVEFAKLVGRGRTGVSYSLRFTRR
ncbi:MAG: hypothetical protein KF850_27925 [Labilithrix sp.]|nr:hypothetical protein [Labilithrix sp.]